MRLKCGCGGYLPKYYTSNIKVCEHYIGDPGCYRTECTLKEQRLYCQHEDGRWSRLKISTSENSLDA